MDYTSLAEDLQDHTQYPPLCPNVLDAKNYTYCLWATTITAWDHNAQAYVALGVTCKRWGCPYCARQKIRRLAWMCKNAEPNKLLTVTVAGPDKDNRQGRYPDGKTAWEATSAAFPELIRYWRSQKAATDQKNWFAARRRNWDVGPWGECEYLRVLELQENGMPHFHAMVRALYMQQQVLHDEWKRLIGEPENPPTDDPIRKQWAGLNLKAIDESFATFRYLFAYLTKLHKIPWTDRHVSYSKNFFRAEDLQEVAYAKLDQIEKHACHPWQYLRERYAWESVQPLRDGLWVLPGDRIDAHYSIDPKSIGLPTAEPTEPEPTTYQKRVPGIDAERPGENDHLSATGKRGRRKSKPLNTTNTTDQTPPPPDAPF